MYERFYELRELPFELTPDPKYLYLSRQHREALSNLEYGLSSAKGLTVLIGEAGTGKTTLLRAALASDRCRNVSCVSVHNPTLTRAEFVEVLSGRFGLSRRASRSKAALLSELDCLLRQRRAGGQITALVFDEAQSLTGELLEEIRLLANSETTTEKLLPLVLVGQPELHHRLNDLGLRQLKQRVTLRCEITPLSLQETADYIVSRIRTAGGDAVKLFTWDAVVTIFDRSGGVPRTISVLCDNALLTGCGLGQRPVTREVILEVARDFDLTANGAPVHRAPSPVPAEALRREVHAHPIGDRIGDPNRGTGPEPVGSTATEPGGGHDLRRFSFLRRRSGHGEDPTAGIRASPHDPATRARDVFASVGGSRRLSLFRNRSGGARHTS